MKINSKMVNWDEPIKGTYCNGKFHYMTDCFGDNITCRNKNIISRVSESIDITNNQTGKKFTFTGKISACQQGEQLGMLFTNDHECIFILDKIIKFKVENDMTDFHITCIYGKYFVIEIPGGHYILNHSDETPIRKTIMNKDWKLEDNAIKFEVIDTCK